MADSEQEEVNPTKSSSPTSEQLRKLLDKWSKPEEQNEALSKSGPLDTKILEKAEPKVKDDLIHAKLIELLEQRNNQREKIFDLAKTYCWTSLIFLMVIVAFQIFFRLLSPYDGFRVFDGNELEVIVVGVFGQFVGLLYVITKALYDDTPYKELFKDSISKR